MSGPTIECSDIYLGGSIVFEYGRAEFQRAFFLQQRPQVEIVIKTKRKKLFPPSEITDLYNRMI